MMKPAQVHGQKPVCIFCKDDKEKPKNVYSKQVVYESRHWSVLVDNSPLSKGHLLVVPNDHADREEALSDNQLRELPAVKLKVKKVFKERFQTDDVFEMIKHGPKAGQSVRHLHIHLIPVKGIMDQLTIYFNTGKKLMCGCCARPMLKNSLAQEQLAFRDSFSRIRD